jgi:Putative transposase of IS4/5 family (DUF4096)
MRYKLADNEWAAIKPMLPNKPRGVPRVNDRRVLIGIFWVLRSGAPWRDLPRNYGPYTTCYNRFVRWLRLSLCQERPFGGTVCQINSRSRLNRAQRSSATRPVQVANLRNHSVSALTASNDSIASRPLY